MCYTSIPSRPLGPWLWGVRCETAKVCFNIVIDHLPWPSVCGWYAVLCLRRVPWRWNNVQNKLRRILSRSKITERGMPWSFTTSRVKTTATVSAVYKCLKGKKCEYSLKQSTTTKIKLNPLDFGSMKSMVRSSQTFTSSERGWSWPTGARVTFIVLAHITLCKKFLFTLCYAWGVGHLPTKTKLMLHKTDHNHL